MKKWMLLLLFSLSGMVVFAYSLSPFVKKAESGFAETTDAEGLVQNIVNTNFSLSGIYDPKRQQPFDVLVSRRIESTYRPGVEGADSTLEAVAWVSGKARFDTQLWVIRDSADAGEQWGDFYRTTKFGCCGAEDTHRAYSFTTGEYAFSFTTEPVSVDIPNTPIKRDISYISANAQTNFEYFKKYPRGIGVMTLFAGNSTIDRIILESDDGELAWSPKLSLVDAKEVRGTPRLSLWHSNGVNRTEAVTAFSVKLSYYEGMDVIVPVNGDKFDVQKAVLPQSVTVRRISAK